MKYLPISVLIPTMNRPEALERTLNTYLRAESLPTEIVIVDQSENKEVQNQIIDIIKCYSVETKIVYFYQDLPSLTMARNRAVTLATENILVFSDDDIDVYSDTLEIVHLLMSEANIALIAATNDNFQSKKSYIGYILGTKSFKKRKIGHVTNSMLGRYPDHIVGQVDTQWAMGYFFAVKKHLIDAWNIRWDENLTEYAYAEDLDFSYSYYKKAKESSMRCILDDRLHVKHMVSTEYRVPSKKRTYMYVINRAYLSYKHNMGRKAYFMMKWCNFWITINRATHHENPEYMRNATKLVQKYKKNVMGGELNELYKE